jgi:hypothetical protein
MWKPSVRSWKNFFVCSRRFNLGSLSLVHNPLMAQKICQVKFCLQTSAWLPPKCKMTHQESMKNEPTLAMKFRSYLFKSSFTVSMRLQKKKFSCIKLKLYKPTMKFSSAGRVERCMIWLNQTRLKLVFTQQEERKMMWRQRGRGKTILWFYKLTQPPWE